MADSIASSSIVRVSGLTSTKTGVAPASRKALAVEQKVNDGMITSSPCPMPSTRGIASSASVQDGVSMTWRNPSRDFRTSMARADARPSVAALPPSQTEARLDRSSPVRKMRLNGTGPTGSIRRLSRTGLAEAGVRRRTGCATAPLIASPKFMIVLSGMTRMPSH